MFRPFEAQDLDACIEIYLETFASPPWNESWDPVVVRARLDQIVRTPGFFGAILGAGEPEGFALGFSEPWHEGSHFYLKEMCVRPTLQRRGHGSALMEYLTSQLVSRDIRRIYLLTARGDLSQAFYSKAGFYISPKMILMARRLEGRI